MFNVQVIAGSLRKGSFNKQLAQALIKLQPPQLQMTLCPISDIPLYNQDLDHDLPEAVVKFKNEITAADGVLFVTPEYNRSIPGVLKNVIDWGTRPYGQNCWANKPMAFAGISPGSIATAVAQSHLRSIMVAIDGILLGLPEVYLNYKEGLFDQDFMVTVEGTRNFLRTFLDRFADWLLLHKG